MSLSSDKNGTPNSTAAIISSIGLSPLLIGISGVLHEAYVSKILLQPYSSKSISTNYIPVTVDTTEIRTYVESGNGPWLLSFTSSSSPASDSSLQELLHSAE